MKTSRTLFSLFLITLATGTGYAGNFVVDKTKSELAADMHASPSHDFTSVARDYLCDIEIDPETLQITKATCRFKFEDLDSEKKSRDEKMCRWMNIKHYPEATYTMSSIAPSGKPGHYLAKGDFKMHGKSLPLQVDVTIEQSDGQITLTGKTELNYEDWGLEKVRLLFFSVDSSLSPRFKLVGKLKESQDNV